VSKLVLSDPDCRDEIHLRLDFLRHANSRLTLDVYAQALTPAEGAAHLKVVEMIRPTVETEVVPMCSHAQQVSFGK